MRVVCPTCQTVYDVPESQFGGRPRRLRCEACGAVWRASPDGTALAEAEASTALAPLPRTIAEPLPEPIADATMAPPRPFGQPVDDEADQEMQQAMAREQTSPRQLVESSLTHDEVPQEAALLSPPHLPEETAEAAPDRFADLVHAARNRTVEVEPDAPVKTRRLSSPLLIVLLVIFLVLALAVLERHTVMRLLPGTVKIFRALHLA